MPKEKVTKTAPKIKKKKAAPAPEQMQGNLKLILIFFLIGIFIGGFITLFYNQQKDLKEDALTLVESEQHAKRPIDQKVQSLLREAGVGKPIIAQVRDKSIIEDLPRYAFADVGDNVLLYDNIFVIYDEAEDKIVSVIPRSLLGDEVDSTTQNTDEGNADGEEAGESDGDDSENSDEDNGRDITKPALEAEEIDVEVRNGGTIKGFAGTNAKEIKSDFGYSTTATNATNTYENTVIVNLGGDDYADAADEIQQKYDVTEVLTELPNGEKSTDADIVVIVVE